MSSKTNQNYMKVETKIKIIQDESDSPKKELSVLNDAVHNDRVTLKYGNIEFQVNAEQLRRAILYTRP